MGRASRARAPESRSYDDAPSSYSLGSVKVWIAAGAFIVVGALLPINAELDLLEGPRELRAVGLHTTETHGWRASIWAHLRVREPDGAEHELNLSGWAANDAQDRLSHCTHPEQVSVTVLEHLDRVIDVRCE